MKAFRSTAKSAALSLFLAVGVLGIRATDAPAPGPALLDDRFELSLASRFGRPAGVEMTEAVRPRVA